MALNELDSVKLDKEMQEFLNKTESFKHINRKVFFEFYKSLQTGKSLFDLLSKEYDKGKINSLISKINRGHIELSSELSKKLNAWRAANEAAIKRAFQDENDEEKKRLIDAYGQVIEEVSNRWDALRDGIFKDESARMLKEVQDESLSKMLVEQVVIPWFEPKIKSIELKRPDPDDRLKSNDEIEVKTQTGTRFDEVLKSISQEGKSNLSQEVKSNLKTEFKSLFKLFCKSLF